MGVFLRNGNYYIDYYANGKRIKKKIGSSKSLALKVLHKKETEVVENKYLDIKIQQKIKFEDFANDYLELYSKVNNKSWKKSDLHNVNTLKKYFSGKYLYEITMEMVEKFKSERIKEVSPARVNRNISCLKSMFNRAIEWGKIENNPVIKVKLLKENNKRLRYLEKEEITNLISNCSEYLKPIVIIALNTGMRKGEIFRLEWNHIDFKRGIIYILDTKNGEKREIPINKMAEVALISVKRNPDSPYIFCNKEGKPFSDITTSFFTAMKKTGIINFRFHDLRHTFASQLVMSGIDLNTVRELLGHKSLNMTLRYAHLSSDHKKRAVDILNEQIVPIQSLSIKEENSEKKEYVLTISN